MCSLAAAESAYGLASGQSIVVDNDFLVVQSRLVLFPIHLLGLNSNSSVKSMQSTIAQELPRS